MSQFAAGCNASGNCDLSDSLVVGYVVTIEPNLVWIPGANSTGIKLFTDVESYLCNTVQDPHSSLWIGQDQKESQETMHGTRIDRRRQIGRAHV